MEHSDRRGFLQRLLAGTAAVLAAPFLPVAPAPPSDAPEFLVIHARLPQRWSVEPDPTQAELVDRYLKPGAQALADAASQRIFEIFQASV